MGLITVLLACTSAADAVVTAQHSVKSAGATRLRPQHEAAAVADASINRDWRQDSGHVKSIHKTAGPNIITLPRLNIKREGVLTAGCSHAADFAHQVHIAFSSLVGGACVFSGQPYHCAVQRFSDDPQVPQTPESSVPRCDGCDPNMTLVYDHCKNHPEVVDVGKLPDYPRRACGNTFPIRQECIDDPAYLFTARVFIFRGTYDRCYLKGAVENVAALYGQMIQNATGNIQLVTDQPFPHTLPVNSTPFWNGSTPSMYDGPGHCLRWVLNDPQMYATDFKPENIFMYNQSEFVRNESAGLKQFGWVYIPDGCKADGNGQVPECRLLLIANNCNGDDFGGNGASFGESDFPRYAESNNIVILKPCVGGHVDTAKYPNSDEIQRGLLDVYGQLSEDYAMQSAPHMHTVGAALRRVMGQD